VLAKVLLFLSSGRICNGDTIIVFFVLKQDLYSLAIIITIFMAAGIIELL